MAEFSVLMLRYCKGGNGFPAPQHERERVVIRCANRIMKLWLKNEERSLRQNPIDRAGTLEARRRSAGEIRDARERIAEPGIADGRSDGLMMQIRVEIARNYDLNVRGVVRNIVQNLQELAAAQAVIPTAFEVHVVHNQFLFGEIDMADERHSSAEPPLERLDAGNKPSRKPEVGLTMESENTRVRNGKPGERRLTMIGTGSVLLL